MECVGGIGVEERWMSSYVSDECEASKRFRTVELCEERLIARFLNDS